MTWPFPLDALSPRGRRLALAAAALAVLGFGAASAVPRALWDEADFPSFWRAGRDVLRHGAPSAESGVERYLPVFDVLHAPLGALPLGAAAAVWYALSLAALVALPRQIERLSGVSWREQWPAFLVMAPLAVDNLGLGQSAPVLLWLALAGLARAREGRAVRGGFALGCAAVAKLLPTPLLGVPVLLGRARGALAGFAAAVLVAFGVTAAVVGTGETWRETRHWAAHVRAEQSAWALVESGRSLRYNNQGLGVTLARTLGDMNARPKGAVRLASWPWPAVWALYGALLAALLAVGARAARAARRLADERAWLDLTALAALGMLLVAPLVWTHYFLWMLPALVAVRRERWLLLWGGIAFNAALAVPPLRGLGFHMACALALYVWIARGLWRDAGAARATAPVAGATRGRGGAPGNGLEGMEGMA